MTTHYSVDSNVLDLLKTPAHFDRKSAGLSPSEEAELFEHLVGEVHEILLNPDMPDEESAVHFSREGNVLKIEQQFSPHSSMLPVETFKTVSATLQPLVFEHAKISYLGFRDVFPHEIKHPDQARESAKKILRQLGFHPLSVDFVEPQRSSAEPVVSQTICLITLAEGEVGVDQRALRIGLDEFKRRWAPIIPLVQFAPPQMPSSSLSTLLKQSLGHSAQYITREKLGALSLMIDQSILAMLPRRIRHEKPLDAPGIAADSITVLYPEDLISFARDGKNKRLIDFGTPDLLYPYQKPIDKNPRSKNHKQARGSLRFRKEKGYFKQETQTASIVTRVSIDTEGNIQTQLRRQWMQFTDKMLIGEIEASLSTGRRQSYKAIKRLFGAKSDAALISKLSDLHSEAVRRVLHEKGYPYLTLRTNIDDESKPDIEAKLFETIGLPWPKNPQDFLYTAQLVQDAGQFELLHQLIPYFVPGTAIEVCGPGKITLKGERIMFRGWINSLLLNCALADIPVESLPGPLKYLSDGRSTITAEGLDGWLRDFIDQWKGFHFLRRALHIMQRSPTELSFKSSSLRPYLYWGGPETGHYMTMMAKYGANNISVVIRDIPRKLLPHESVIVHLDAIDGINRHLIGTCTGIKNTGRN